MFAELFARYAQLTGDFWISEIRSLFLSPALLQGLWTPRRCHEVPRRFLLYGLGPVLVLLLKASPLDLKSVFLYSILISFDKLLAKLYRFYLQHSFPVLL